MERTVGSNTNFANHKRRRRRPALACEPCRQKKIRCDRNLPCNGCIRSKSQACTYEQLDHRSASRPQSPTNVVATPRSLPSLSSRDSTVALNNAAVPSLASSSLANQQAHITASLPVAGTSQAHDPVGHQTPPDVEALVKRVHHLERLLSDNVSQRQADQVSCGNLGPGTDLSIRGIFHKGRLFGQSHYANTNLLVPFGKTIEIVLQNLADEQSTIYDLNTKCKNLAKSTKVQEIICQPVKSDFSEYVPAKELVDPLVHAYLRTIESVHRVVHIPSFWREYGEFWENPKSADQTFVMTLLLIMAIGTCFYPSDKAKAAVLRLSAIGWINTVETWLSSPFEKARLSIGGVQVHCLLLVARQTNYLARELIWISAGSLIRKAMHMGFHLDPIHFPKLNKFECEMRRRLWATIMEIAIQSSLDVGQIPLIRSSEFETRAPSNIDDLQMDPRNNDEFVPKPMDEFTQSSASILLFKSLPLRLRITEFANKFHPERSYEEALQLHAEFSTACGQVALFARLISPKRPGPTKFQIKMLELLTHRFLLALHQTFTTRAKENPNFYFSQKVCLEVASLLSANAFRFDTHAANDADFHRICVYGTGLFRNVPLQAIVTVGQELFSHLEGGVTSFAGAKSNTTLDKELRKGIEDFKSFTETRLVAGETSYKGYVFSSGLLAHVNAIKSGEQVDRAILRAVEDSMKDCFEMIKRRSEAMVPIIQEINEGKDTNSSRRALQGVGGDDALTREFGQDLEMDFDLWPSPDPGLFEENASQRYHAPW